MKAYATDIFESVKAKQEGAVSSGKGGKAPAVRACVRRAS